MEDINPVIDAKNNSIEKSVILMTKTTTAKSEALKRLNPLFLFLYVCTIWIICDTINTIVQVPIIKSAFVAKTSIIFSTDLKW